MHYTPEEIIIKLKKIIKILEQFQADMKDTEISPAQGRIIYPIIENAKGFTMLELSEIVGVDKALVSRTVSDLEAKGIVERDKKSESERSYKIILSKKGRKLCDEKLEKHKIEFEKWRVQFTIEEVVNFMNVIDKITNYETEGEEHA